MDIDIFCRVVDNYGDIGVCWRLSKELLYSGNAVTIFVDNLEAFQKIFHAVDPSKNFQICIFKNQKVKIYKWQDKIENYVPGDMVIEAFACNIPQSYIDNFTEKTVWINLEYLSAEDWVESCHKVTSLQNKGLKKFFFFPGFTNKTGGINFNKNSLKQNHQVLRKKVCKYTNLPENLSDRFWMFSFCYETPNLKPLLQSVLKKHPNAVFLLPESRSTEYLKKSGILKELKKYHKEAIFHEYPMVEQSIFDEILSSTDMNLVRGEDSICQAILCGIPFIWHIYEQEENAHMDKLNAMLDKFCQFTSEETGMIIKNSITSFNDKMSSPDILCANFNDFMIEYDKICQAAVKWSDYLYANDNLSTNLLKFYYDLTESKQF